MDRRFVYVIGSQVGPWKIGSTSNLVFRLAQIQHASPVDLCLLYSADLEQMPIAAEDVERVAHGLLERFRLRGEWFGLPDGLAQAKAAIERAIEMALADAEDRRPPPPDTSKRRSIYRAGQPWPPIT